MRVVVFGPDHRVGVLKDERVVDLQLADERLPADLLGLIELGDTGKEMAMTVVKRILSGPARADGAVTPINDVALHAPTVFRPRIGCAAGNYALHITGSAKSKGLANSNSLAGLVDGDTIPTPEEVVVKTRERNRPRGFWKDFAIPRTTDDDIPYPDRCERLDYEGEIVAVIGQRAKDVPKGEGGSYIWGVSLHNDWSIRQENPREALSFNLPKNWDGSASIGPCVVVGLDPADIDVETHVNGELRQKYNSGDMIFSHADFIEYLSRDFVLLPGDMISGGSGPGTATDSEKDLGSGEDITPEQRAALFLQIGDVVEVSSPRIGTLRNRIVAKT